MNKRQIVAHLLRVLGHDRLAVVRYRDTSPDWVDGAGIPGVRRYAELVLAGPRDNPEVGQFLRAVQPQVIFLDPWHTWHATALDLQACWACLPARGALVVHDCWPTYAHQDPVAVDAPDHRGPGVRWSGVTHAAWASWAADQPREHLRYWTVDCDYGVGVALRGVSGLMPPRADLRAELLAAPRAFDYLSSPRGRPLLHLMPPHRWLTELEETGAALLR